MNVETIIKIVRTAAAALEAATAFAAEASATLSETDANALKAEMKRLREENDAGHTAFQAKLAAAAAVPAPVSAARKR